jgi:hypothetical protein
MSIIAAVMLFADTYSLITLSGVAVCSGFFGFFISWGALAYEKRRVLMLEDEMLSDHARILSLQKKNVQLQNEIQRLNVQQGFEERVPLHIAK